VVRQKDPVGVFGTYLGVVFLISRAKKAIILGVMADTPQVHLQTLGCRLNEAELETWARDFRSQGFGLAQDVQDADLVIINTCAVTQESVRKSRNLIRRAQRSNPQAKLVMSGCYAALSPEQAADDLGVDLVVSNQEKERLVAITQQALQFPVMPQSATEPGETALLARGRQRAFIKVQDGCRYRCTYCVVTLARGEERSRPMDDVIEEIKRLEQQGIQEVVLAGVHLGGYGSDIGLHLSDLISAVLNQTEIPRIRLGSVEPWDLDANFWLLFSNPRLMPHLHLPIQSGSDNVLRRMSRRCKTAEFSALIEQARAQIPNFNVTTDIIVGFPGETEDEWQQTLAFVKHMRFAHVHIFSYSARNGTKAAMLPNTISRDIKRQRSQQLHDLVAQHKREILQQNIGHQFEVLVESQNAGYTPNFLRVQLEGAQQDLENQIVTVNTLRVDESGEYLICA
jgi:threonylcarbamoyladenosine tRNA methylthiotransferase MtaB